MTSILVTAVGAVLLLAGPILIERGLAGQRKISTELAQQKIIFPDGADLPQRLSRYAGTQVRTGSQAQAFADLIGAHVAEATGGRTYAQVVDEWQAGGRTDERLTRLRQTAFMGQTLRGTLLGAYQAWQVSWLVIGLGGLLTAVGVALLALGVDGR